MSKKDSLLAGSSCLPEQARKDLEEHYDEYKRLIQKMAHKYVRNRVEYDDLVQEALIGLIYAHRDFDPSRSTNFHTYAIYRMKGKMYDYCIAHENPIYVPTHVAKAASYVKQMQRLLDRVPYFTNSPEQISNVILNWNSPEEAHVTSNLMDPLYELKRKLGNIAKHSKMEYETLAKAAMESLSLIVSDEVLTKYPKETDLIEEIVSNKELRVQIQEQLGERKFTVLSLSVLGWSMREIAEELEKMGYTNKDGECITRQAVKAILDETKVAVQKMKVIRNLQK